MNIKIEEARPEHVEDIQEVFYRTWLDTYPNKEFSVTADDVEDRFKNRNSEERLGKRREDILNIDVNKKFLVALDGERVVGLCRAMKDDKENRINAIYVLPEYQGKGVGTKLWNEVRSFFDPLKNVLVGVVTYNQKAISFYSKLGFVDTGLRHTDERYKMKSGTVLPELDMILRVQ